MSNRVLPLKALRAFESAARHNSFNKAANELHVSPAAISQQIKILEEFLQVKLFSRAHNPVELTAAGSAYLPLVSEGFSCFLKAGQQLSVLRSQNQLNVSVLPSVASKWLLPNLHHWLEQHPDISFNIFAQHNEPDLDVTNVDFRISYGLASSDKLNVEKLFLDEVFPVCSPALLQGDNKLETPDDLCKLPLLHVNWGDKYSSPPTWEEWAAANKCTLDTVKGLQFNLSHMAIQAALEGRGVMLGQKILVANDIAAGKLIKLFDHSLSLPEAYCVAYSNETKNKTCAAQFLSWLHQLCKTDTH